MTGFMPNTAVEVVNSRYRCLNRPGPQVLLDLLKMIEILEGYPGRLLSGQHVDYHILKLLVDF